MLLFLTLFSPSGWSDPPPLKCSSLPEQGPAGTISVHVVKVQDQPGVVCARANSLSEDVVGTAGVMLRLQVWKKKWWWMQGQFIDFQETFPGGVLVGGTAVPIKVSAGGVLDQHLPLGQPAPPGRYRVCVHYQVARPGERTEQEVCSEGFSLP